MLFNAALLAAMAAPLLVFAQSNSTDGDHPNAFKWGEGGITPSAGQDTTLQWTPTTDGTVTLILRSGASSDLNEGAVIASSIPNSGSYSWSVDSDITRGSDYTVEIVDDNDSSNVNYSPYFVVESDNTVASSTGQVTLGAPTASSEVSASMATTSVSTSMTDSSMSSGMTTATETTTKTSTKSSASMTGSSTMSAMSTMSTMTSGSSSSSEASQTTPTQSGLQASSTSEGAASRATALAGMLGVVALGAMAL